MGWLLRFVLAGNLTASNGLELSVTAVAVVTLLSPLIFRVAEAESWLPSRCRPILPSFSIAMKLVRTLERGLGLSPGGTER